MRCSVATCGAAGELNQRRLRSSTVIFGVALAPPAPQPTPENTNASVVRL